VRRPMGSFGALILVLAMLAASLTTFTTTVAAQTYDIITVPKVAGINWFIRMEEGVNRFREETGHNATFQGPSQADGALQARLIESLIARRPDAIAVVPFSPETLEPVLKRAMDAGIVVITHEASNQQNTHYDLEAFDNKSYGEHLMQELAKCMNYEGKYTVSVGSLTSRTHNEWVDAAIAYQREHYPNMQFVGSKNETYDDQQRAYDRAREMFRAHPDLKGWQGSASTDVAGVGLAVSELGLEDRTCVVGTSLPSIASKYLETGAVDLITFWDPALAGYLMNKIATIVLQGGEIRTGDDLGIDGYRNVRVEGKVIYGQAWVDVTAENMHEYPF